MKKLFIDIPALIESKADVSDIQCEYLFHRKNCGALSLLEVAEFSAYCRQCDDAFCIDSCPREALDRQPNGVIKRFNMRCVGCKSCTLACPFGTIFPEVMNYVSSKCDSCLNQLEQDPDYEPVCVRTSPPRSFMMTEISENLAENIFYIGNYLAVKSPGWLVKEKRL